MKLATFAAPDDPTAATPRAGTVDGDRVTAFDDGSTVLDRLVSGDRTAASGESFALSDVTLLAPCTPGTIYGAGLSYASHALQDATPPPAPVVFIKPATAAVGPSGPVRRPAIVQQLDYEGELAVVIGAHGEAAGYCIANDLTARDLQSSERQWARAKGFDDSCPFGPWITTADEVPDPHDLALRTWVNGELRQEGSTGQLMFTVPWMIDHVAAACTLRPGDLILTGSPGGAGMSFDPPRYLEPGDRVRIEIEGLGAIEHAIA